MPQPAAHGRFWFSWCPLHDSAWDGIKTSGLLHNAWSKVFLGWRVIGAMATRHCTKIDALQGQNEDSNLDTHVCRHSVQESKWQRS